MAEETRGGGCCCGAVRYRVQGAPVWSAGCCCRDCARASGTPFVVWVGFQPEKVAFLSDGLHVHSSSKGVLRGHCPRCGTSISYGRDPAFDVAEPLLYVAAASLDNPDVFPPTEVVWYGQRPAWLTLAGDIPLHDTVSPNHVDRAYNAAKARQ